MRANKKTIFFMTGMFAAIFLFCGVVFQVGYRRSERIFYDKMAAVAAAFPENPEAVMQALKDTKSRELAAGKEILGRYGYAGRLPGQEPGLLFFAASLTVPAICTIVFGLFERGRKRGLYKRAEDLTAYLRQVEAGEYRLFPEKKQDALSGLEDGIYKTVLALRESRETVKREKENLAKNLADISHQIKTPLTSLSVLGELLARRTAEGENAEIVRKMENQTERLARLSSALLTLSKADAGVLAFDRKEVPVGELLESSLEPVWPLLEAKGQTVKIVGERRALEEVCLFCDLGWMGEAIGNLLKNASEHTPEKAEIRIAVRDNPVFTGITLEDEGPGFSQKDLPHLFERFYRGEAADKDSAGIGLSLAKTLIEAQKGEIRAENRREGGARFSIKFYKNI